MAKTGKKQPAKPNPHGVNQYTGPDPRQALYLSLYLNPESKTFANSLQSALAAGFSREYSESLTAQMPVWLSEKLGQDDMLRRAERNLSEILDLNPKVQAMGAFGPLFEKKIVKTKKKVKGKTITKTKTVNGKPIMVTNSKLLQIKANTSEFIAERVGRALYGKEPSGGKQPIVVPVQVNINEDRKKYA